MCSRLISGDGTDKTTIEDITTTENTEDDVASDGDYSVKSDFIEISLTGTMIDADNDEIEIVGDPQQTNYYAPIQDDHTSNNEQNNESDNENDENASSHDEARESDEEIRPDKIQSYNGNDNLIPSVETISGNTHLTKDNDTTKPMNPRNTIPHESITR